jgi:hypothetical protein
MRLQLSLIAHSPHLSLSQISAPFSLHSLHFLPHHRYGQYGPGHHGSSSHTFANLFPDFGLSILSIYLFLKLRASRAKGGLELRAQPTTPEQQLPELKPEPAPAKAKAKGAFSRPELLSSFSDASNPDWENDFRNVFENLSAWLLYSEYDQMFTLSSG